MYCTQSICIYTRPATLHDPNQYCIAILHFTVYQSACKQTTILLNNYCLCKSTYLCMFRPTPDSYKHVHVIFLMFYTLVCIFPNTRTLFVSRDVYLWPKTKHLSGRPTVFTKSRKDSIDLTSSLTLSCSLCLKMILDDLRNQYNTK